MNDVISETIEYIDNHLEEDITIEELAETMNYSVYYFQRMFSTLTGYGIKEYIRERRLTRAAFNILNSTDKIIDIAFRYGFKTPESFTKAFKNQHGVSPIEMRKNNIPINAIPPLKNIHGKQEIKLNVRIEELEEQTVSGFKHVISLKNEQNLTAIPKLWNQLNANKDDEKLFEINDGPIKGVLGICQKVDNESMEYVIGSNTSQSHKEYDTFKIPGSKYAVFEVIGPLPQAIQEGWKEIMSVWIPTSTYDVDESLDFELYTDEDPFSEDLKSEIWIKLK